jgi:hypothetical protein
MSRQSRYGMRPGWTGCDEGPELALGLTRTEGLGQASVRETAVITMLDGRSTDELRLSTSPADDHRRTPDASMSREAGQPMSNRIRTRGNPPETALVSAALVKPASSNSLRVPT